MKNKRVTINEESSIIPTSKKYVIKNREKLRKKLKVLLDKQQTKLNVFPSGKNTLPYEPKVVNNFQKPNPKRTVLNLNNKGAVADKDEIPKKITPNKSNPNGDDKKQPGKRKSNEKSRTQKKSAKLSKIVSTAKGVPAPGIKKLDHVVTKSMKQLSTKKKSPKIKKLVKRPIKGRNVRKAQGKNKAKAHSEQEIKKENIKEALKEEEIKVKTYRGPLRPHSSESDTDDSLWIPPVKPMKYNNHAGVNKVTGNEQALTRLDYEDANSSSNGSDDDIDDSCYSDDDDYSPNDFDEYSSNTDDDSSFEDDDSIGSVISCLTCGSASDSHFYNSQSDSTYEPPKDILEDIYIANGTAIKHDLSATNEVCFDSDTSSAQIIEIPNNNISEPTAALRSETLKNKDHADNNECESDDTCPELVPIDSNSTLMDDDSDSEFYSDISTDLDSDTNTQCFVEASKMTPQIFRADKTIQREEICFFCNVSNGPSRNDYPDSPLDLIINGKCNTASYKVITANNEIVSPETEVEDKSESSMLQPEEALLDDIPDSPDICVQSSGESVEISEDSESLTSNHNIEATPGYEQTESPQDKSSSTFRTLFFNAVNSNHVIVLLKQPLYIYGTVKLKLIAGSLEIFGYNPKRNEVLEIFSPRGYSSLKIEASRNTALNASLNEEDLLSLTPYFMRSDLEAVIEKFNANNDAIVILERNDRSKKVNMLKKYMVEHLFPNMNSIQSDRPYYTSEFLLRCVITRTTDKALIVDNKWKSIKVHKNSKIMVIGGKAIGKSTLVRYLINSNLNQHPKILLIDLDIGQPEIFVPQTVSATTLTVPLLGPGYFLNKEPDKGFIVGQTNVVFLPQRYIENVQLLIDYCQNNEEYNDIPWIINTMGYNKGFGHELIAVISGLLHPTNIVQLESDREINNFDLIMSRENIQTMKCNFIGDMVSSSSMHESQHNLTLMTSVIPSNKKYQREWDMKPKDMRLAMIVSRLSAILTGHAEWVTDIKPVCASIDDLNIINLGDDYMTPEDLLKTLVGNLVYLCRQESETVNECLGIGIVRGIDYPLKQIYLLPAVPLEVLEKVNCLAICGIPLPSSILINQGPKVKGVASYVYNTVDKASSMYIKQIYHRPQHFLTGRHKSFVG